MKNTQKGSALVIVLLAIIIVLLGAGLYVYTQQNKKVESPIKDSTSPISTSTTTLETVKIETKTSPVPIKNMVSLTSQSLNISFNYPTDYELVDHGATLVIFKKGDNNSGNIISLSKDIGTVTEETAKIKETAEARPTWKLQISTVTVDNKTGTQFTIDAPAGDLQQKAARAVAILIQDGNNLYTFRYTCATDNTECANKSKDVLASIRFR